MSKIPEEQNLPESVKRNVIVSLVVFSTLLSWSLIFIDGSIEEGPIIQFLINGLNTMNIINRVVDILSLFALSTAVYYLIRQNFKPGIFSLIYLLLLIKFYRHINFHHSDWIFQNRTLLPFIAFFILAITSIWTMRKRI